MTTDKGRRTGDTGPMTTDELEFSISQYLDGTLPATERDALETRLGSDAGARALYAEYESLQGVLKAAPLPTVRWDAFAEHISAAVAREEMPAQSYKLTSWFRTARVAIAASVLVATGIGFTLLNRGGQSGVGDDKTVVQLPPVAPDAPRQTIVIVRVDRPAAAAGDTTHVVVEVNTQPVRIAVGPTPATDSQPAGRLYADGVVTRRSRAVIVSAAPLGQDGAATPF